MSFVLQVGRIKHEGWKALNVSCSIETLSGGFILNITDKWEFERVSPPIQPGDECKVFIDDIQVIEGYIDSVELSYDANAHAITITGRDKTADLVDCHIINGTGEWKNLKLEALVADICKPFGIKVSSDIDTGQPIPTFNIEQGETAYEAIKKACSLRAALAIADRKGGLLITRAGTKTAPTALIEGVNIFTGAANYDYSERYSKYIVKGQAQYDANIGGETTTAAKGIFTDENITRYRPFLLIGDGEMDNAKALLRAKWEAATRIGKSRRFEIGVRGWRDAAKELWTINQLVNLDSNILSINETLLIAEARYQLDDAGELTTLVLLPPDAYKVFPKDVNKKFDNTKKHIQPSSGK